LPSSGIVPVSIATLESSTGATAYLSTTAEYADEVSDAVEGSGVESRTWHVGDRVKSIDQHLF
jgi:hypothetical protein